MEACKALEKARWMDGFIWLVGWLSIYSDSDTLHSHAGTGSPEFE